MTKELRAAIMQRSKLRQKFLKERTNNSKDLYNRQRNLCVSHLRKTKRDFFKQVNNKVASDIRKFWQTISPLFSEKAFRKETIILKDNNGTIRNNHPSRHTTSFQRRNDVMRHRTTSYRRGNDVVCLLEQTS